MSGDRFSSSTSYSRWLYETELGRLDHAFSGRFLKVATHPQFDSPCDRHENQGDYSNSKRYQLPVTQLLFHLDYADLILRGFSADASNVIINIMNLDNWRPHHVSWCEYSENQITSPPDRKCDHFPKP